MQFYKALCFLLSLILFTIPVLHANSNLSTEEQNTIVKEELAAVQVMQEICPTYIGKNAKFDQNMQILISEYLKDYSDKSISLEKLASDSEYNILVEEARNALEDSSNEENKFACEEVLTIEM